MQGHSHGSLDGLGKPLLKWQKIKNHTNISIIGHHMINCECNTSAGGNGGMRLVDNN